MSNKLNYSLVSCTTQDKLVSSEDVFHEIYKYKYYIYTYIDTYMYIYVCAQYVYIYIHITYIITHIYLYIRRAFLPLFYESMVLKRSFNYLIHSFLIVNDGSSLLPFELCLRLVSLYFVQRYDHILEVIQNLDSEKLKRIEKLKKVASIF